MLEIETRETGGTSSARAVRRTGKIPGVLYGNGREALPFAVESRHLREALSDAGGRHAVLEVKVPGAKTPVHAIIKAMQLHPLRDTLQHFDLLEVRMDRPIQATVSIVFVGEAEGVKTYGGILAQNAHELTIEALPGDLPEHVELDITRARDRRLDQALGSAGAAGHHLHRRSRHDARERRGAQGPDGRGGGCRGRGGRGSRGCRGARGRRARGRRRGRRVRGRGVASFFRFRTRRTPVDLLVAGLGNPGSRYALTRHNVGYLVAAELATRWHAPSEREKHGGALSEVRLEDGTTIALLRPLGFMNLSGGPVRKAMRAYGLEPDQLICVHDDVEARFGQVRAKLGGGLGGHNGLRSVAELLGTRDFGRVRCGVGRPGRASAATWPTGCSRRSSRTRIPRRWSARLPTASS